MVYSRILLLGMLASLLAGCPSSPAIPDPENRRISVRISLEVDKWLEQRAEARVRSKADVVREIIEDSRRTATAYLEFLERHRGLRR